MALEVSKYRRAGGSVQSRLFKRTWVHNRKVQCRERRVWVEHAAISCPSSPTPSQGLAGSLNFSYWSFSLCPLGFSPTLTLESSRVGSEVG